MKKLLQAQSPARLISLGFAAVILIGSVLLILPCSVREGVELKYIDSLYTSTSAVCVTGLIAVDAGDTFTPIGQFFLALLIQIGGLGVIACTASFFLILGKRISMKGRILIQQAYGLDTLSGMVKFIIRILKGTFLVEGIGAVLFMIKFIPEFGVIKGIWYGIFHSISAFCNAGVDIIGNSSFMEYVSSPLINFTTMFLIVSAGLGFTVWHDVASTIRTVVKKKMPKRRVATKLELQSKVVITMTAVLLLSGTLGYFILEYNNPETIGNMNVFEKFMASAFQSVTTRTAGFATVSQSGLTESSRLLGCVLMFIGGSPGGTAGGIKTTTMAMVLLTVICVLRGKRDTECFGRRIEGDVIRSSVTILVVTFTFWLCGVAALTIFEPGKDVLNLMYEASSAMGTVGLSADLTPHLTRGSHIVLMILMYAGRIGPMTMALVFSGRANKSTQFRELPEKRVMIG